MHRVLFLALTACTTYSPAGGTDAAAPLEDASVPMLDAGLPIRDAETFVDATLSYDAGDVNAATTNETCATLNTTFGAAMMLTHPTATFSQASFPPSLAIDGVTTGNGWATLSRVEAAAFRLATDSETFSYGTRFVFRMHFQFLDHPLGRFRFAYTKADRTLFADGNLGLTTPGIVGEDALWRVLHPRRVCANNAARLFRKPDDSLLVEVVPTKATEYIVEADTLESGITGIRLEVMQDPSLPSNGPGLFANGNFVLTLLRDIFPSVRFAW
jgi:hypothetical protein